MTFNTSKCQGVFRNRFTGQSGVPFSDFGNGKKIKNMLVDPADVTSFKAGIPDDIKTFYYKSLLSYAEGLAAVVRNNLTWATIKLYYSFYFGLRCSLLCRNVILVRANKHLYYIRVQEKAPVYEKPTEMTDHGGAIEVYSKFFHQSDIICMQKIDTIDAYKWMKNCREVVNYKDAEFHDPDITEIWEEIIEDIARISLSRVLRKYIEQSETYCSRSTTAILAIPTVRIWSFTNDIKKERIDALSEHQKEWIKGILGDCL